jgi:hypothetical protein
MRIRSAKRFLVGAGIALSAVMLAARTTMAGGGEGNVVAGQVVDAVSHTVLDGVRVTVKGTGLSGRTGDDGSFFIDKVPGEQVALVMSRADYKSREVDILVGPTPLKWTVALWRR